MYGECQDASGYPSRYNPLMRWRSLWEFIHKWQWLLATIAASVPTLYYGPNKAFKTWDEYCDRFRDARVLDEVRNRRFTTGSDPYLLRGKPAAAKPPQETPYAIQELAELLGRSENSIKKSLVRL